MDKRQTVKVVLCFSVVAVVAVILAYRALANSGLKDKPTDDSCGLFSGTTAIEITLDDEEYRIAAEGDIKEILSLCETDWEDPDPDGETPYYNMTVEFQDARAKLYVDTETLAADLNGTDVKMSPELMGLIEEKMVPAEAA